MMARQLVVSGPDDPPSADPTDAETPGAAPPVSTPEVRGTRVGGDDGDPVRRGARWHRASCRGLLGAWFFGTPGGPLGSLGPDGTQPSAAAVVAVYGGTVLLVVTWLRLLRTLRRHPGVAVRRVVGVVTTWAVPILVAPPLFSRDVYSYAGQGEMVSHHISPYLYGPGVLGATPFSALAGQLWSNTPSPYGPTFLSLDGLVARLARSPGAGRRRPPPPARGHRHRADRCWPADAGPSGRARRGRGSSPSGPAARSS